MNWNKQQLHHEAFYVYTVHQTTNGQEMYRVRGNREMHTECCVRTLQGSKDLRARGKTRHGTKK